MLSYPSRSRSISSRARRGVLAPAVLAVLALAVASCAEDGGGAGEDSGVRSTTTTSSSTTAAGGRSTTTIASADADATGDSVPDGEHSALVRSVDAEEGSVTLDVVDVLTGTAAVMAYLADTDGAQLEGEVYIRNRRETLSTLPVDEEGGPFSVIQATTCCEPTDVGFEAFAATAAAGFPDIYGVDPPFTITVEDGTVTSMVQQYLP